MCKPVGFHWMFMRTSRNIRNIAKLPSLLAIEISVLYWYGDAINVFPGFSVVFYKVLALEIYWNFWCMFSLLYTWERNRTAVSHSVSELVKRSLECYTFREGLLDLEANLCCHTFVTVLSMDSLCHIFQLYVNTLLVQLLKIVFIDLALFGELQELCCWKYLWTNYFIL